MLKMGPYDTSDDRGFQQLLSIDCGYSAIITPINGNWYVTTNVD